MLSNREEDDTTLRSEERRRPRAPGSLSHWSQLFCGSPASCAHHHRRAYVNEMNVVSKEKTQCHANLLSKLPEKSEVDNRDFVVI